jgi:hypothetical protein
MFNTALLFSRQLWRLMLLIFKLIAKYDELFNVSRKDGRLRLWVSGCQTGLQREPSASQPSFSAVWTDAQRSRLSHGLEAVLPRSPHDNLLGPSVAQRGFDG